MTNEIETEPTGLDRRSLLRRGALVGGALVWATPVVQSLTPAAYANGSPQPCGDISWVGVLIRTGTSSANYQYRVYKMEGSDGYDPTVITFANGDSTKAFARMLTYGGVTAAQLQGTNLSPEPFTASVGDGGDLVFTLDPLGNATVLAWMVHDGNVEGPGVNNEGENTFALGDNPALVPAAWVLPGENGTAATGTGAFTWSKPGGDGECKK